MSAIPQSEKFVITTPIFYVNDRPHLGTSYTMVCADAIARWHRLIGDDVYFLTGTDEHGLKIARAAEERNMSPQAWVDKMAAEFERSWSELSITYDEFIRTTEERHRRTVQRFLEAINENGYIYKDEYSGWYCVSCEAYYDEAELVRDHDCPVHQRPVEWLTEENYFFALSKFEERLLDWYEKNPTAVVPFTKRNEALGFIRQGLKDVSITRTSIDWGIPVPWDPAHVVYVWSDALINYVTATGYGDDQQRFEEWWPSVHHLIGKDILRFHCVWWPAMCMAAGIEPPKQILVHGWLIVGGEKMSKSLHNQIDPVELAADVGLDPLRYHLLRDVALGADGDFSYEGLIARYNTDLANNLGNLVQRVATVVASKCNGKGPAPVLSDPPRRLSLVAEEVVGIARSAWGRSAPHEALEATWRLVHETNVELEIHEPWKLPPGEEVEAVLGDALEALRIVAILCVPAIPKTAQEIWSRLGFTDEVAKSGRAGASGGELSWGGYPGDLVVTKGDPIFPRRRLGDEPSSASQG